MDLTREEQLLTKIKLLEEIISDTEKIAQLQTSLEQKKAFAASLKNFGKIPKSARIALAHKQF